jgi:hypothetical protein
MTSLHYKLYTIQHFVSADYRYAKAFSCVFFSQLVYVIIHDYRTLSSSKSVPFPPEKRSFLITPFPCTCNGRFTCYYSIRVLYSLYRPTRLYASSGLIPSGTIPLTTMNRKNPRNLGHEGFWWLKMWFGQLHNSKKLNRHFSIIKCCYQWL